MVCIILFYDMYYSIAALMIDNISVQLKHRPASKNIRYQRERDREKERKNERERERERDQTC